MATTVNREEFLRTLQSVQPGLATREGAGQETCFVFMKGRVYTFNDEVSCRAKSGLGKDITGAVRSKKFVDYISHMTEDEIDIEQTERELLINGKHSGAGKTVMESEILLRLDQVERPTEYFQLHEEFCEAIGVVQECARSRGDWRQVVVHIHPKFIEANDRFQMCRWNMKTGFTKPTLVKRDNVKHVTGLAVTEFGETPNWVHFRNADGVVLSCRRYSENEEYPDFTPFLTFDGHKSTLPKGFASEADLDNVWTSELGEGNNRVTVEVRAGRSRLRSEGLTGSRVGKWKEISYDGDPFSFLISPKMLSTLVEKYNECVLSEGRLAVYDPSKKYTYLAWLITPKAAEAERVAAKEAAQRAEEDAARAESGEEEGEEEEEDAA